MLDKAYGAILKFLPQLCHNNKRSCRLGTIRQRKSRKTGKPAYEVQVRVTGYPAQTRTFPTRGAATEWMLTTESAMKRGRWEDTSALTSASTLDLIDRYERSVLPKKKGAVQEASILRLFRSAPFAELPLARLRPQHIAEWRDARLDEVSEATVLRNLQLLGRAYELAIKDWGFESFTNPVKKISLPRAARSRERRITETELQAVFAESRSEELEIFVRLCLETSMRRGELAGLRKCDVDLKHRLVRLEDTKNGRSREVPISEAARPLVETLLKRARRKAPDARLFSFRADAYTRAFIRARERARERYVLAAAQASGTNRRKAVQIDPDFLVNVTLHDSRHEATSRLIEAGLSPIEAAQFTGHKDLRMLKRYTHLQPSRLAEKLDALRRAERQTE